MTILDGNETGLLNEPEFEVILREVFGLSHNAIITCIVVIERGPITAEEIADIIDVSSSTVSMALGNLVAAGILERFERNLQSGGTVNVYESVPLETQQTIYRRALFHWLSKSIERINEFDLEELKARYRTEEEVQGNPRERATIYWETGTGPASSD